MTKQIQACVQFAKFVRATGMETHDAATLLQFARLAFKAGEREANTGKSADPARNKVEELAKRYRIKVRWPGLWPVLIRKGQDIYLPDVG